MRKLRDASHDGLPLVDARLESNMVKNFVLTVIGIIALLSGIILVLREWASLLIVFKGVIGGLLAVGGLFILFLVSGKSSKQ